ncbi:hypothetical protein MNBD_GAMMA22-1733 [hydrothermal vent metagenome]|uniref:AB hydrolase-1 domain-containing protein n=1 Tax=hydrothermal vent metagenome TaxID=652676 RepID=A0A3B1AUI4_9ZZZZ
MTEIEKTVYTKTGSAITYQVIKSNKHSRKNLALLLLHGLASNMTRWSEFVANTTLVDELDVLRMDLRGHGKSMNYGRISIQHWCDDILQVLNTENYNSFIIVGHSLGAQIAMQFAFKYPKLSKALVLIDPVYPDALKGTLGIIRRFRYVLLTFIYVLLLFSKFSMTKKPLPYRDLHQLDIKTRETLNNKDADIAKLYMNPFKDLIYIPLINYCQDMFEVTRKIPDLKQIKSAVFCLLSKGATVSDIEQTKSYVNQFPNNKIQIIDANHWLLTEKPIESKIAIETFCLSIIELEI